MKREELELAAELLAIGSIFDHENQMLEDQMMIGESIGIHPHYNGMRKLIEVSVIPSAIPLFTALVSGASALCLKRDSSGRPLLEQEMKKAMGVDSGDDHLRMVVGHLFKYDRTTLRWALEKMLESLQDFRDSRTPNKVDHFEVLIPVMPLLTEALRLCNWKMDLIVIDVQTDTGPQLDYYIGSTAEEKNDG